VIFAYALLSHCLRELGKPGEPARPHESRRITHWLESGMALSISIQLAAFCRKTLERAAWLARLPDTAQELQHRWGLKPGRLLEGEQPTCSFVTGVVREDDTPAVLKIAMPHMEGRDEIPGLRFWAGDPTVRLLASDEALGAMLLERCMPGTPLRTLHEPDQDAVIAGLLRRLWRSPCESYPFRPLSSLMEYWSVHTLRDSSRWPDAGLVRAGLDLFKELPRTATRNVVLATDLHAGNVLCAEREPWLVIDPKPFVGDPAYDATQHLFNCSERLRSDPMRTIQSFSDVLGVDHERVRLWTFARAAAEPRDDWSDARLLAVARALRA
jgi:streptomycin 6-kinase